MKTALKGDVMDQPAVWQMIKEAVEHQGGRMTNAQIKEYIKSKYPGVNEGTINCQITICSVNRQSRINYAQNKKARKANSQYDFLFGAERGVVELYNSDVHGCWEISENEQGELMVVRTDQGNQPKGTFGESEIFESEDSSETIWSFPLESHLRDFLAQNLGIARVDERVLSLFSDSEGRLGIEYPTAVGPIDILAVDDGGNFVVFELKVSRGVDRALGQILRYMGWVKQNLAGDKMVKGVIVAQDVSQTLKYAVSMVQHVSVFEYKINFSITQVDLGL